jgi:signal transduction histidine kinase
MGRVPEPRRVTSAQRLSTARRLAAARLAAARRASALAGIDLPVLEELCPFFLVLDRQLRPRAVGRVLDRLLPGLPGSGPITDSFELERPRPVGDFAGIAAVCPGQLALLRSRALPGLLLRGQFAVLAGGRELLFFGAPAAAAPDDLTALGLAPRDFPPHLGLADYLLMAQAQATTVLEAKAMAERLRALNTQLEHEIAERARMEEDLRLAHKLEAVGQLAAGLAHEINTPVQFVGDNLRFLARSIGDLVAPLEASAALVEALSPAANGTAPDGAAADGTLARALARARQAGEEADAAFLTHELPRAVSESLDGIERVGRIIHAMKEFAQPGGGDFDLADLNQCIGTTLVVSNNEYRQVADLVTDLDPQLPRVRCVPGEINQVLLNLIVNAAHAIGEAAGTSGRGTITVTTRRRGDHVEIAVRDTGPGIPEHVRDRVFDPFFTTKQVGRGTGQGLSTCRAIVATRHGGRLEFTTELGVGTEFTVLLPVAGPRHARDDPG